MYKFAGNTVAVAMSGGVDSSVAAAILKEQGYNVFGLMLRMWSSGGQSENRCCSVESIDDAREVAELLKIPFYVLDIQTLFKDRIVAHYLQEIDTGNTPNPCILCNRDIRFGHLLNEAKSLGADGLATGHYVRLQKDRSGKFTLLRGMDLHKDQSYMLYRLTQPQLAGAVFPVGEFTKEQIRLKAKALKLPVFSKRDSQDLCFLGKHNQKDFLQKHASTILRKGDIRLPDGTKIGSHDGLGLYTLGQRKGLGVSWEEPLYVLDKDNATDTLHVGPKKFTPIHAVSLYNLVFSDSLLQAGDTFEADVQVRYKSRAVSSKVVLQADGTARVFFQEPVGDASPGQSAVFYRGATLLGGGLIREVVRHSEVA